MPEISIPYGALTTGDLITIHNELAAVRDVPPLSQFCHLGRCELVRRVALLRARKPIPPKPKAPPRPKRQPSKQPLRDAILKALAFVSHFEDRVTGRELSKRTARTRDRRLIYSLGLSYAACLERVREECPGSKVSSNDIRWNALQVRKRARGFENCKLPQKRAHGMRGKFK